MKLNKRSFFTDFFHHPRHVRLRGVFLIKQIRAVQKWSSAEKARAFLTENPGHQTTNRNKLPGNLINQ